MADSLATLRRTRRGRIFMDNSDALSLPAISAGAKEVVGAAQEAASTPSSGSPRQCQMPSSTCRCGESHPTRNLTPKDGNAVEPTRWGKESAEGMWRRRRTTPTASRGNVPAAAAAAEGMCQQPKSCSVFN
jgi:hypothetical protein